MNLPWTYSGVPTVSVPVTALPHGVGPHGLPLGIQCASAFATDEALLDQMRTLERYLDRARS
jgi:Asp-tRNA(Asn)/Glu-tRNA(Gln) amidotransferase A subunit family amidase